MRTLNNTTDAEMDELEEEATDTLGEEKKKVRNQLLVFIYFQVFPPTKRSQKKSRIKIIRVETKFERQRSVYVEVSYRNESIETALGNIIS